MLVVDLTLPNLLSPELSSNERAGFTRGRGKGSWFAKGRSSLLVLGVICFLGVGEARWFGDTSDSVYVEGVSIEVCRLVSTIHSDEQIHMLLNLCLITD